MRRNQVSVSLIGFHTSPTRWTHPLTQSCSAPRTQDPQTNGDDPAQLVARSMVVAGEGSADSH